MEALDNYSDKQLMEYRETVRGTEKEEEIVAYLLDKYKYLVLRKAKQMFLLGGDKDDLIQEGMIGLFKAVREYNPKKEVDFAYFAELCITRQLYTAVSSSQRKKHQPLNTYVSFYDVLNTDVKEGGKRVFLGETLSSDVNRNPEELWIDKENLTLLEDEMEKNFSKLEKQVAEYYIEGKNYQEIAVLLGKTPKSIDNAIQRIKKKLKVILSHF